MLLTLKRSLFVNTNLTTLVLLVDNGSLNGTTFFCSVMKNLMGKMHKNEMFQAKKLSSHSMVVLATEKFRGHI